MDKEAFINKARLVHGNKYNYDKIPNSFKSNDSVTIICPKHGEFVQCARTHYRGHGCTKCKIEKTKETNKLDTDLFLKKYHDRFGELYDTSLVVYKDFETKVKMICEVHGIFEMTPHELMRGKGCPICGKEHGHLAKRLAQDEVIERANKIHNFKYSYEKFKYTRMCDKSTIICPIHGEFEQTMRKHLMGSGCPKCGTNKVKEVLKKPIKSLIEECNKKHNGKYKYIIDFDYINNKSKLHIVCPTHGDFWQEINGHLHGQGCPKCAHEEMLSRVTIPTEDFIERARKVHGDKYDYSKAIYKRNKVKLKIICPKHGVFLQTPLNHLNGHGCPKCSNPISKWEKEVYDFISSLGVESEQSNRKILGRKEIDIFVPKWRIGIECDGLRWHNEIFKGKYYHLNKTNDCSANGIRLYHIFEDEWHYKSPIWKSMLKNMFGLTERKIYGRKCDIFEINDNEAKVFLNVNHLQGYAEATKHYGLKYGNELIMVMSFKEKDRCSYELVRFCSRIDTNVIGGVSKLFVYFVKKEKPNEITTSCDKRLTDGVIYKVLGFKHIFDELPRHFYIKGVKRIECKDKEREKIYDCGKMMWKWSK